MPARAQAETPGHRKPPNDAYRAEPRAITLESCYYTRQMQISGTMLALPAQRIYNRRQQHNHEVT